MTDRFERGDIVQLNSGSPDMVVTSCDGKNVEVQYPTTEIFPIQCIKTVATRQSTKCDQSSPLPSKG